MKTLIEVPVAGVNARTIWRAEYHLHSKVGNFTPINSAINTPTHEFELSYEKEFSNKIEFLNYCKDLLLTSSGVLTEFKIK